jgi:hypothetical protein
MKLFCFFSLAFLAIALDISAQYSNNSQLAARIKALDQKGGTVNTSSLVKTAGGKDIFLVTVSKGDKDNKPGIAVVGGIQGTSLASAEIVMQMIEKIVSQNPSVLDEVAFYFFPDVSPDASGQYFAPLKYERVENARPYDDDRDGKTDEDGYDDLNNDGLITWMRIKDPDKGEFLIHPDNPSVMVKADISKNQKAEYIVIHEGIDNDKDGKINEDLPGGVIFNKNFSYNYPYFGYGAGENSFSEEESLALAKFLFDHWNIFALLCIGPENNLSGFTDLKLELTDKNIPSSVNEKDKPYFESVVNLYKKMTRLNDSAKVAPSGGDMLSWAYFHYNRFAFGTPAWNVSKTKNNRGSPEFDYLQWASDNGLQDQTFPWQKINHPDFPGKVVEIGGIKPFLTFNPPLPVLDSVANQHLEFLIALASMHPALTFNDVKITKRSDNLYMVEVEITNSGRFPTMPALAVESKWIKKVRLDINTSKTQEVVGGRKVFLYDLIAPGETVKAAWLLNGKGKISLKAGSPQTGYINREIELN